MRSSTNPLSSWNDLYQSTELDIGDSRPVFKVQEEDLYLAVQKVLYYDLYITAYKILAKELY